MMLGGSLKRARFPPIPCSMFRLGNLCKVRLFLSVAAAGLGTPPSPHAAATTLLYGFCACDDR